MGKGGVTVADLSSSTTDRVAGYWFIDNVYLHYLTAGDRLNMRTLKVQFAAWKYPLRGREMYDYATTSGAIFDGNGKGSKSKCEFVRIATDLYDTKYDTATHGLTRKRNPQFKVEMSRAKQESMGYEGKSPPLKRSRISYQRLHIRIRAI